MPRESHLLLLICFDSCLITQSDRTYWIDESPVALMQVCSLLHQRYRDFSPALLPGLVKLVLPGGSGKPLPTTTLLDDSSAVAGGTMLSASKAQRKRTSLRLVLELTLAGLSEDATWLQGLIKDLCSTEQLAAKDSEAVQGSIMLALCLAKHGRPFLGLPVSPEENEVSTMNCT